MLICAHNLFITLCIFLLSCPGLICASLASCCERRAAPLLLRASRCRTRSSEKLTARHVTLSHCVHKRQRAHTERRKNGGNVTHSTRAERKSHKNESHFSGMALRDELLKSIWHAFTALDLDQSGKVSKSQLKVHFWSFCFVFIGTERDAFEVAHDILTSLESRQLFLCRSRLFRFWKHKRAFV